MFHVGLAPLLALFEPRELSTENGCFAVERMFDLPESGNGLALEIAANGPTSLSVDGQPLMSFVEGGEAVLGAGVRVLLTAEGESGTLTVHTCAAAQGRTPGFYLRVLG